MEISQVLLAGITSLAGVIAFLWKVQARANAARIADLKGGIRFRDRQIRSLRNTVRTYEIELANHKTEP